MMEFVKFPKMARLTRECIITEKIDGINAQIGITDDGQMFVGSRTRWLGAEADNFGFYAWAMAHRDELLTLGPGRHFGEWWGLGIQRGYGLHERRLSLFNVSRWHAKGAEPFVSHSGDQRQPPNLSTEAPACCSVVPVLYRGLFGPKHADNYLEKLLDEGSMASPGFMNPEGIVVLHVAAGVMFKKTLEKDEQPKAARKEQIAC
jgi:hypothetical protein